MIKAPQLLALAIASALAIPYATAAGGKNDIALQRAKGLVDANPVAVAHAAGDAFVAKKVKVEANGLSFVRYAREYKGLRVLGGDFVVKFDGNGRLKDVSATMTSRARPDVRPQLDSAQAQVEAGAYFDGQINKIRDNGLVVWAHGRTPVLAYEVNVVGNRQGGFADKLVYVDAKTGAIVGTDDIFKTIAATGTGKTLLLGNVPITTDKPAGNYQLVDPTRGGGNTRNGGGKVIDRVYTSAPIMTDADNIWGNNNESDVASEAADAHYGVAKTWDYYASTFGRTGIYNDGVGVKSIVNVIFQSAGYRGGGNAGWYGAPYKFMAYGSGDSTWYPVVAVDVAGHEMTHGVTESVNGLVYSGDAGGLNEAASDIMGTMVEFYANNAADPGDYLIGEKIWRSNPDGKKALRYMFRPGDADAGRSYNCYPAAGFAGVDPHYSSGPANNFFYLLAEGPVSPAGFSYTASQLVCNGDTTLVGVGRSKAQAIWYRAMDLYFTSGTTYPQARAATISAATDLYGAGSAEVLSVQRAWSAVSVN